MIETERNLSTDEPTVKHPPAGGMSPAEPPPAPPSHGLPKPVRALIVLFVLGAIAALVWYFFPRKPALPKGVIAVSGRIESDDTSVGAKTAGRLKEIRVREGDTVVAGQILAVLDDDQVRAREDQARSAVQQAEARLARARQQISVLQQQSEQSRLGINQSRIDAEGRVNQAQAQVAAAEASLAQAEATAEQARYDADRFGELAKEGIEPERVARQTQSVANAQDAAARAARKQVDAARAGLETARANLANPAIRTAQTGAIEQQIVQAQSDVAAAQADAERSRAQLTEAQANRGDLTIVAPIDGTIATRSAEPGEVVAAGTPIVTIVNLNEVYLRGFVPEGDIGRVKVDQPARVFLDSSPNTPIDAFVSRIDPEASFTPENTYFRDDRVKQVVGVKLQLRGAFGYAKPGMPADGEILVEGSEWPEHKR